jgi:Fe2+ transport system protein B
MPNAKDKYHHMERIFFTNKWYGIVITSIVRFLLHKFKLLIGDIKWMHLTSSFFVLFLEWLLNLNWLFHHVHVCVQLVVKLLTSFFDIGTSLG